MKCSRTICNRPISQATVTPYRQNMDRMGTFEVGEEHHVKARMLFCNELHCAEERCSVPLINNCTTSTTSTTDHKCNGNEIANGILSSLDRFEDRRKQLRAVSDLYRTFWHVSEV